MPEAKGENATDKKMPEECYYLQRSWQTLHTRSQAKMIKKAAAYSGCRFSLLSLKN